MADLVVDPVGVGTIVAGTYEVTQSIGRGGSGAVWAARHLRLPKKQVAVKVLLTTGDLDPEVYGRFRREAEIVSQLGHPNIVEVFDFNELPNGTPYIVLELLKGESLGDRLRRGPIGLEAALDIVRQIGSALNAAHKQQIIHRDLKPANIFLCPDASNEPSRDHAKVLDFGISKIRGSDTVHTQANVLMGTPRYMSPEQALGRSDTVDQRTDEFALAAILYEMLTGRPAFSGEGITEILMQVVHETPKPLREVMPGLPSHVVAAIGRALEKDPDRRFADVAGFVSALTRRTLEASATPTLAEAAASTMEATAGNETRVLSSRPEDATAKVGPIGTQRLAEPSGESKPQELEATPSPRNGSPSRLLTRRRLVAAAAVSAAIAAIVLTLGPSRPFWNLIRRTSASGYGSVADALLQLRPQTAQLKVSARVLTPEPAKIGDSIQLRIECDRDCYAFIFGVGTTARVTALVPNEFQRFTFIKAGDYMVVPSEKYELRAKGPAGIERFKVIASAEPLATVAAGVEDLDLALIERLRSDLGSKPWGEQLVEVKVE